MSYITAHSKGSFDPDRGWVQVRVRVGTWAGALDFGVIWNLVFFLFFSLLPLNWVYFLANIFLHFNPFFCWQFWIHFFSFSEMTSCSSFSRFYFSPRNRKRDFGEERATARAQRLKILSNNTSHLLGNFLFRGNSARKVLFLRLLFSVLFPTPHWYVTS